MVHSQGSAKSDSDHFCRRSHGFCRGGDFRRSLPRAVGFHRKGLQRHRVHAAHSPRSKRTAQGFLCVQTCAVSTVMDLRACQHPEGAPTLQQGSCFRSPSPRQALITPARSAPSSGHSVRVGPAHAGAPVSGFLHSASCFRVHPCRSMVVLPFYGRITFHRVGGPSVHPFGGRGTFGFFRPLALVRHTAACGSRVGIRSHLGDVPGVGSPGPVVTMPRTLHSRWTGFEAAALPIACQPA